MDAIWNRYNAALDRLAFPRLGRVEGTFVITNNMQLEGVGIFSALTFIGGSPAIEQKEKFTQNIFPVLHTIDSSLDVTRQGGVSEAPCSVADLRNLAPVEQLIELGTYHGSPCTPAIFDNADLLHGQTGRKLFTDY